MRSACFEGSLGTGREMTCTTCHDPHVSNAERPADHFNQACQTCHGPSAHESACTRPGAASVAEAMTGDCVSCHMRSGGTSDIPHVSFTDHWIRRDPPPSTSGGAIDLEQFRRTTPFTLVDLAGERQTSGAEAEVTLALATFMLYETSHRLPAYLPQVVRRLRAGLAAGVERTDARVTLGRALFEMDSLGAAQAELAEAVRRDPQAPYAQLWLGVVEAARGESDAAVGALREAVRLAPQLTEARAQLGAALMAMGRWADAADVLEKAVAQDPLRHSGAWNDLGFARLQQGDLSRALTALRRSVALDPRLGIARVNLGAALFSRGDLDAARAQFDAALRIDPNDRGALGNLGLIAARQGRTGDARARFRQLLQLDPSDARARAALADLDR